MALADKTEAVIEFLQNCPTIAENPLFFNFGNIEAGASQITVYADDVSLQQPYIDGSVKKRFTLMLDKFSSVAYNSIVESEPAEMYGDENMENYATVQSVLEWINEQGEHEVFPDFGAGFIVDDMKTQTNAPEISAVETSQNPPMAIYRIAIQIDYVDYTNCIWNN